MTEKLVFPQKFIELLGTEKQYNLRGEVKCVGIIQDLRWSQKLIVIMKNGMPTNDVYYGIELKIKPKDGSRAIWTKAFNSMIPVMKEEVAA